MILVARLVLRKGGDFPSLNVNSKNVLALNDSNHGSLAAVLAVPGISQHII